MNSPSEPRLNKLPFILSDLACLLAAGLIGYLTKDPFAPLPLVSIVVLVVLGGIAVIVPYLTDYAADIRESTSRLRDELELQIKRAQAAGESLTRAAAQIKAIEEAVHKSARDAETLPYRMQEKLAEFNEALAAKESDDREALEQELEELRAANSGQLRAVADKMAKAAADWAALEIATRQQLTAAEAALAKLQAGAGTVTAQFDTRLAAALQHLDAKVAELEKALKAVPAPAPKPAQHEEPVPVIPPAASPVAAVPPPPAEAVPEDTHPAPLHPAPAEGAPPASEAAPVTATPVAESAPATTEPPKPKKPRAPRKPKAEEVLAAMSAEPAAAAEPSTPAPAAPAAVEPPAAEPEPTPAPLSSPDDSSAAESSGDSSIEASTSSDGATRLLATAYIGIGNKLFIRGDGPGLSWDRGVPMQFVSIGKWGWFTHDAAGPVRIKLYKNDDAAPALSGELTLEPGRHTEVTALF